MMQETQGFGARSSSRVTGRIFTSHLGCNISAYLLLRLKSNAVRCHYSDLKLIDDVIKTSFDGWYDGKARVWSLSSGMLVFVIAKLARYDEWGASGP